MVGKLRISDESMDGQPIRLAIELDPDGVVKVFRSPGCTRDDVRDLCSLVAGGHVDVRDLTRGW